MHVVVVGAGVIGVSTAYCLRQDGFEVTVVERRSGVAQETSFGNAGMLCPGYIGPWAQPGMVGKVFAGLLQRHSPVVFQPSFDAALWRWLRRWWSECRVDRFRRNKATLQRLALYSRGELHEWRKRHALEFEQTQGFLTLFRTARDLARAEASRQSLVDAEVPHVLLDAAGCRALEPALHPATPLAGGLHLPDDETGNCAFFTHQLKDIAAREGVVFRFGETVRAVELQGGRAIALQTDQGRLAADAIVLAAGVESTRLLRPLRVHVPLLAIKGYSATIPITAFEHAPFISVMDEAYKVAVTRMGNRLRVAGTAEVGTRGLALRDGPLATLEMVVRDWYPYAGGWRQARWWAGARPMLPDGPPALGASGIPGLFLNLGHGSSGWTLACGSARVLTDLVAGRSAAIDLAGTEVGRFR